MQDNSTDDADHDDASETSSNPSTSGEDDLNDVSLSDGEAKLGMSIVKDKFLDRGTEVPARFKDLLGEGRQWRTNILQLLTSKRSTISNPV